MSVSTKNFYTLTLSVFSTLSKYFNQRLLVIISKNVKLNEETKYIKEQKYCTFKIYNASRSEWPFISCIPFFFFTFFFSFVFLFLIFIGFLRKRKSKVRKTEFCGTVRLNIISFNLQLYHLLFPWILFPL